MSNVKTSRSYGGWPCKQCSHERPEWIVHYTNQPREGDYEEECVYCSNRHPIYANKETLRELRRKELDSPNVKTKEMMCQRCHQERIMIVEPGPTIIKNWWIGECVECGKRHDIW